MSRIDSLNWFRVISRAVVGLTIRFLTSGLSLRGAPYYVERLAVGVLLIIVVVLELVLDRPELRARLRLWRLRRSMARAVRAG